MEKLVEEGKAELEKVETLDTLVNKEVVTETKKHETIVYAKAPPREYCEPFMRFSIPCSVEGHGALDYGDYGRITVRGVKVKIHGFDFLVDFVVLEYGAQAHPLPHLYIRRIDQEEVFVVRFFWKEQEGYILFGLPGPRQGVEDLRELLNKGAQRGREAEVFQVSNDDTAMAQRRLEDKQPEDKTNTNCLVKEQKKEYQTGWKIKTGNVFDFFNQRSTYLVNRSPSSAIGLKKPVDMLGSFRWLASIKQGILEPVKVVLYRNMGFNESGEYKKTFIGSGVGTGSMQVLHGFKFEVKPLGDHTFEVEPQENV
nr:hypothetical protein [Tanacetum cinerariifolium]